MIAEVDKFMLREIFRAVSLRQPATSTNEIKAFFALRGLSLTAVAMSVGEDRSAVSRVVNYERPGPRIRKLLRRKYRGLQFQSWTKPQEGAKAA
jgi:hypothetical protein